MATQNRTIVMLNERVVELEAEIERLRAAAGGVEGGEGLRQAIELGRYDPPRSLSEEGWNAALDYIAEAALAGGEQASVQEQFDNAVKGIANTFR